MYMQHDREELCMIYDRVDLLWTIYSIQGAPYGTPYEEIKRRREMYLKYDPVFQKVDEQRQYLIYLLGG
jgi:hypothetical protein